MKQAITISKTRDLRPSQDYNLLRSAGLQHIEKLTSDLWSDYNIHDPGITMLELLCYAITDLGYRTSYDIKDLLGDESVPSPEPGEQFFTAREILPCNPVTANDYRKLLIDISGVKNAWVDSVEDTKPDIYLNCKKSRLQYDKEEGMEELNLRGLYRVTLELEEDPNVGDLNHYTFEMPLFEEMPVSREKLIVNLPNPGDFMKERIRKEEIKKIRLLQIKSIEGDRFRFTGRVEVTLSDDSKKQFMASLVATQKDVETSYLQEILKKNKIEQRYLDKMVAALKITWEAWEVLHAHRNLCEDFEEFRVLDIEEILLCTDIEVTPEADLEEVLAKVYYQVELYIAPSVHFYTLKELLDKKVPVEEIFNGPPLAHGFIDDTELDGSTLKEKILASDLIRIIMRVEGVVAVRELTLSSAYKGEFENRGEEWILNVGKGRAPRLSIDKSVMVLYKENIPYRPNEREIDEVKRLVREFKAQERETRLSGDEMYDIPIPEGVDRNVADYTSVQNDLPNTYGVNRNGINGPLTNQRRAQAKQLKAYLTLYDQLLANYLAQLANIKNLFSFSSNVERTYYYKMLYSLPEEFKFPEGDKGNNVLYNREESPRYYQVVLDFVRQVSADPDVDLDDYESFRHHWEAYRKQTGLDVADSTHIVSLMDRITENQRTFVERRNRFLDHLLSRFGEKFTDYALLLFTLERGEESETLRFRKKVPADLIDDKITFLKEYPELSRGRGKAFNYRDETEVWDTDNVSGLEKRVARLLGIEDYRRRNLSCKEPDEYFELYKDEAGEWRFRFRDQTGDIILRSEGYTRKKGAQNGIDAVKERGIDLENYDLLQADDDRCYFNLIARNGEIIATSVLYDTGGERDKALDSAIRILRGDCGEEGFHLIEHILLRPEQEGEQLLPVCLSSECGDCPGYEDPYSFRASLILPYWPDRFDNMQFRRFLERTVRAEAPAHVHIKICWADREDIDRLEKALQEWLTEKAKPKPEDLPAKLEHLIRVMAGIRSVYPKATLHDCEENEDENPILLDNTILGTINTE